MGTMSGAYMLTEDIQNVGTQSKIYYPISRFALGRRHYPSGDVGSAYFSCKRAKLDNLTEEQKVARRKILNREAAQKARDRKRDMVASMEKDLAMMQAENEHLRATNRFLRKKFFEQEEKFMLLEKKLRSLVSGVCRAGVSQIEPSESAALLSQPKGVALWVIFLLLVSSTLNKTYGLGKTIQTVMISIVLRFYSMVQWSKCLPATRIKGLQQALSLHSPVT